MKLWYVGGADQEKWTLLKDLGQHDNSVHSVAWSNDGTRVVSGGDDKKVKLWYVGTARVRERIDRGAATCLSLPWGSVGVKACRLSGVVVQPLAPAI